jgi:hypothetical protein
MGMHFRSKIVGFCSCALMLVQMGLAAPKGHKPAPQQPPPASVQEPPPPIPQPPPTPEQLPAVPPRVSMNNGMLSITADNSTLGDILNSVRQQTGAALEVPPSIASERVATSVGPGSPREVLQDLLSGSKFDYIIVGTTQDPNAVQRIILTQRAGGPAGQPLANNQPANTYTQSNYQPPSDVNQSMDEEPEPEPAPPEPPPQPQQQQQANPNGTQPNNNQQQPKTPEQLLHELQMMQQQQQQQQRPPRNPQ